MKNLEKLTIKLTEELGELTQALMKYTMVPYLGFLKSEKKKYIMNLQDEIADVLAGIYMLTICLKLDESYIEKRIAKKSLKYKEWFNL